MSSKLVYIKVTGVHCQAVEAVFQEKKLLMAGVDYVDDHEAIYYK